MAALGRPEEIGSLYDSVASRVTPEVIQKLAQRADIGSGEARRAIDAVVASHVDGLVAMGSSSSGALRLLEVLRRHAATESFAPVLAAGDALQGQASTGRALQSTVYGDDLGRRTRCIASSVGISEAAATSIMEMVIPTTVGILAREVQDRRLDVSGLGQRLRDERATIRRAMPSGLAECLDARQREAVTLQEPVDRAPAYREPVMAAPTVERPVERPGISPWLWLLPLLALLGLGLWYVGRSATTTTAGLAGTRWQWQRTVLGDGTEQQPANPGAYLIDFQRDGRVAVQADCNAIQGPYTADAGRLSLGNLTGGGATCPGPSQSDDFARQIREAGSFTVADGRLTVGLRGNAGTMEFVPAR
jgi:heat shock protein HslJ